MAGIRTEKLVVDGITHPVRIYHESRDNTRVSIGKRAIHIRIPSFLTRDEKARQLASMKAWARSRLREKPHAFRKEPRKEYNDGDILRMGEEEYSLSIAFRDKQGSSARILGEVIYLTISANLTREKQNRHISTLLSRCIASRRLPEIRERLHELNRLHFNQEINKVFLKHNTSNWGSSSSSGNINISTRLLFAPGDVIDYVLLHELAHQIEPNHSARFWAMVRNAMPDYKEKVRWLKENREGCRW